MRLLVMSCSDRKDKTEGEIAAWDRYTGPSYNIIKKINREKWDTIDKTETLIISAKYGFLLPTDPIPNYNLKMTETLAKMHRPKVVERLAQAVRLCRPTEIFLFLSPVYAQSVMPMGEWTDGVPYCFVKGGMGYRNQFLKNWYLGETTVSQDGLLDKASGKILISTQENHSKLRL